MTETLWINPDSTALPIRKVPSPGMIVCDPGARFEWLVMNLRQGYDLWGLASMAGCKDTACWEVTYEGLITYMNLHLLQERETE